MLGVDGHKFGGQMLFIEHVEHLHVDLETEGINGMQDAPAWWGHGIVIEIHDVLEGGMFHRERVVTGLAAHNELAWFV